MKKYTRGKSFSQKNPKENLFFQVDCLPNSICTRRALQILLFEDDFRFNRN